MGRTAYPALLLACGLGLGLAANALAGEGLQPPAQDFAPLVLTPPGEAMLLDPQPPAEDAPALAPSYELQESERGGASWYGLRFHKKRTASGELFDMRAFTAAHRTLPFGTRVCVRSLLTGRAVEVRINDRGPFHAGRVIDLSQAAAEKLGNKGLGIKQVSIAPMPAQAEADQCQDHPTEPAEEAPVPAPVPAPAPEAQPEPAPEPTSAPAPAPTPAPDDKD